MPVTPYTRRLVILVIALNLLALMGVVAIIQLQPHPKTFIQGGDLQSYFDTCNDCRDTIILQPEKDQQEQMLLKIDSILYEKHHRQDSIDNLPYSYISYKDTIPWNPIYIDTFKNVTIYLIGIDSVRDYTSRSIYCDKPCTLIHIYERVSKDKIKNSQWFELSIGLIKYLIIFKTKNNGFYGSDATLN